MGWNGDEWRWRVAWHPTPAHRTISVIEPPAPAAGSGEPPERAARRLPFGFAVREPAVEAEPLLWDGAD